MTWREGRLAFAFAVPAFATACAPVPSSNPPAPLNACPANPCEAYDAQAIAPVCVSGACVVDPRSLPAEAGVSPTDDLVLLVTTSQTGFFYPGVTFALPWNVLHDEAAAADGGSGATPGSAALPTAVPGFGLYEVPPSLAALVHWDLGSSSLNTSLPITVSFDALSIPRPDGSTIDLRPMPIPTVTVASTPDTTGRDSPGPNGTQGSDAHVNLAPGTYRATWTPMPPLDEAFGPIIWSSVTPSPSDRPNQGTVEFYDKTHDPISNALEFPTYNLVRDEGTFDGWTAFLRDQGTHQTISNVVPLSRQETDGVQFAVHRIPRGVGLAPASPNEPDGDALDSAQLVLAPPLGSSEPTLVFTATQDSFASVSVSGDGKTLRYPKLPPAVSVTGGVRALEGPVGAVDLVFEALAVTRNGVLDPTDYEFTAWTTATPDASGRRATFSAVLPPGEYRVDVRPRVDANALAVEDLVIPARSSAFAAPDVMLGAPQATVGRVVLADSRPLGGATVIGVPLGCVPVSRSAPATSSCLPRTIQAMSAADGSFLLGLDPGTYRVRVEPPAGSRLPWVDAKNPLVVQGSEEIGAPPVGTLTVPAPLSLGLRLTDSGGLGRGVPNALVRAYRVFGSGPTAGATELGETITDANGNYELDVTPPE